MTPLFETALSTAIAAVGAVGAWLSHKKGKESGAKAAEDRAQSTISGLKVQIDLLMERDKVKEDQLHQLNSRMEVLEGLISQRYDLTKIQEDITYIKGKIDGQA